jgi:hypothetical protein
MTRLHPADLEALAAIVADRLIEALGPQPAPALLTASHVAERLGVTPEYVRVRADELGAVRFGSGPKARLRFDPDKVARAMGVLPQAGARDRSARKRRHREPGDVELLQIRG